MKECFKCRLHLPLSDYYKHPMMADGHLNKCKKCARIDSEERRKIKEQDSKWLISERKRHREKSRKYRENGIPSRQSQKSKNDYCERNPEKRKAHWKVSNALRSGKIHRHPCCICGSKAEAHHEDYSKPLDVIWFCSKHHAEHHVKQRESKF